MPSAKAAASTAEPSRRMVTPSSPSRRRAAFYTRLGASPPAGPPGPPREGVRPARGWRMRPQNVRRARTIQARRVARSGGVAVRGRRKQFAAFGELAQRCAQLVHSLARQTRRLRPRAGKFGCAGMVDRAVAGIGPRGRCPCERRLATLGQLVLRLVEIATEQRRNAPCRAGPLLRPDVALRHGVLLARAVRRLRRAFLPHGLDEFDALFAQDALHAANGIAFAVEQMADAAQKLDVVGTIVAATAPALHRLDLTKPRLPETQHMLRQVEFLRRLADGTKRIRRLVVQGDTPAAANGTRDVDERYGLAAARQVVDERLSPPLIRCLRIADGLNTMTRRGEMGTSLPVLGLRPMR